MIPPGHSGVDIPPVAENDIGPDIAPAIEDFHVIITGPLHESSYRISLINNPGTKGTTMLSPAAEIEIGANSGSTNCLNAGLKSVANTGTFYSPTPIIGLSLNPPTTGMWLMSKT